MVLTQISRTEKLTNKQGIGNVLKQKKSPLKLTMRRRHGLDIF